MKNIKLSNLIYFIFLLISFIGYSQDEKVEEDVLFGQSFVFERVYSYTGCSEGHAHSDKSVIRLKLDIDSKGKVTGGYGSVPCLESGSTYGEITGFAHTNLIFVLWRSSEEGSTYTESLYMLKSPERILIISQGGTFQLNGEVQDLTSPTQEKLLQVSPPPKIKL